MRQTNTVFGCQNNASDSGTVALTGASPVTGVALDIGPSLSLAVPGTLSATIAYNIKASSLTYTAKWQVATLAAPSTWLDVSDQNNAARTAFATGGGTDVASSFTCAAPACVFAYPHVRVVVLTGGSATGVAGHDNFDASYSYMLKDHIGE